MSEDTRMGCEDKQVSLLPADTYDLTDLALRLEQLLAPLGGMAAVVKPGDRVLLKPNLLTGARPTKECTTRPELVYAIAKQVIAVGGVPFLGDSPAFGTAAGVAKANGLTTYAKELGIEIVEFRNCARPKNLPNLRLAQAALGADVVINIPKVKSHVQLTLTLGVKNLFGCVPGKTKAWWHMEAGKNLDRFADMLVDTARAIAPQLTIIDGIIGHEGNGPSGGEPRHLGLLAASRNVFALDAVMAEVLGVKAEDLPTLMAAQRQGLVAHYQQVEILGTAIADLQIEGWQLPQALMPIDFGLPRIIRSTFKHLYIKFLKEPITGYIAP
ncbi:MAG: DUF362 domain-containing protein [Pseudanabaenaceae cyanobacterium bins.68]|nr:DUF362 domain-containing protein [Pseudanabaenaceae cyanobacterium bins.68]